MADEGTIVLQPFEIDNYIDKFECIPIDEMFTSRWVTQSCRLIQLSVQVALETSQGKDEYVQRSITLHNKGLVVIWHLLMGESWRQHLLPLLYRHQSDPISSLPLMLVLQTETAALTILEALSFHEESAEALDALVLDVIDYCVRQLTKLACHSQCYDEPLYSPEMAIKMGDSNRLEKSETSSKEQMGSIYSEVSNEEKRVQMALSCRSIAVIQLLTGCRSKLPLCSTTSLLQTHDVPQLLASLLQLKPWQTIHGGTQWYFQDGQWIDHRDVKDSGPVSRLEGQIWVTLFSLLMDQESLAMYELSGSRRASLLKLQGHLNEGVLSQLPILEPFARWLSALSLATPQQARPPPLIMTLRQLGDGVTVNWNGRWQELVDILAPKCLSPPPEALSVLATSMSAAWNLEALEVLLPDTPVCATCGSPAGRRCSRCRMQWYCRRECQVKDWATHKSLCDVVTATPASSTTTIIE